MKPILLILLVALSQPVSAQDPKEKNAPDDVAAFSGKPTKLDGVWTRYLSPTMQATKFYHQGQVMVTHTDISTKTVIHHMAGVFSFDGKILKEKMSRATNEWKQFVGATVVNRVSFDGVDKYSQINRQGHREYWRRSEK